MEIRVTEDQRRKILELYPEAVFKYSDGVLIDIKTTSSTQKTIKISHRIQLLFYELCRRLDGKPKCDTMEVMYIVKTKVPKFIVIQEPITEDDIQYIKTEIKNMITRLELVDNNPDLVDVIFFNNSNSYLK